MAQLHCAKLITLKGGAYLRAAMLEHLKTLSEIDFLPDVDSTSGRPFTPVASLDAAQQFDAKVNTSRLFEDLGVVDDGELDTEKSKTEAANAFVALIGQDETKRLEAVGALSLPESVKSSVTMLAQYQWNFVEQASELRSMAVSKIVKETDHPDAKIRLRALEMLGKVTEVALFTDRVEIKKTDVDPAEIEEMIREKLRKFATAITPPEIEDAVLLETQQETP